MIADQRKSAVSSAFMDTKTRLVLLISDSMLSSIEARRALELVFLTVD
jgi:hypothetical protein